MVRSLTAAQSDRGTQGIQAEVTPFVKEGKHETVGPFGSGHINPYPQMGKLASLAVWAGVFPPDPHSMSHVYAP